MELKNRNESTFKENAGILSLLKEEGHDLFLASGSTEQFGKEVFSYWAIEQYFVGTYFYNGKPKADELKSTLISLKAKYETVLMVGDSDINDINPAKEAGVSSFKVNYTEGITLRQFCENLNLVM